jgi:glycerol uptake facilitator-like aquaporin
MKGREKSARRVCLAVRSRSASSAVYTHYERRHARSTGPAVFVGGWAISQLWLFWVAPIVGAVLAGAFYRILAGEAKAD